MPAHLPLGVTAVMLPELDFEQQIALCQSLGVTHYVYRPRIIPESARGEPCSNWGNHQFDLTPDRLLAEGPALSAQLKAAGLTPFCTVPLASADNDAQTLSLHLRGAAVAGCARLRLAPPAYPAGLFDYPAYVEQAVACYQRAVALARPLGIKLVIEMHAGTAACGPGLAYNLVRHFDPAELGVILDLPNFAREGGVRPELAVSVVGPWVDHCHVGGHTPRPADYDASGFRQTRDLFCPLTESDLNIPAWLAAVAALGREVPLVIEDYTAHVPGADRLRQTVAALRRLAVVAAQKEMS